MLALTTTGEHIRDFRCVLGEFWGRKILQSHYIDPVEYLRAKGFLEVPYRPKDIGTMTRSRPAIFVNTRYREEFLNDPSLFYMTYCSLLDTILKPEDVVERFRILDEKKV